MINTVDVIQIGKKDIEEMMPLFIHYMEFYKREISLKEFTAYFESIMDDERVYVFLAKVKGENAGLMVVYRSFSSFELGKILFLNDLWVEPNFRTVGVGQALMQKVKALAKETGCKRVDLQTDLTNAKARALYEKSGMVADKEFINYSVKIHS